MPTAAFRVAFFLSIAVLGCGPSVELEGGPAGQTEASTGSGSDDPVLSTGSTSGTSGFDPDTSGGETTDEPDIPPDVPEEPTPCAQWPDDGSEVLEFVAESNVLDWAEAGFSDVYYSYTTDESPVPGQPALGLTTDVGEVAVGAFGATTETLSAEMARGRRLRIRSEVALSEVENHAGLWLRIDGPGGSFNLDNGSARPRYGTSRDWQTYEIVVDVPEEATSIVFGSLLTGPGTIVVSNPTFEVVSEDVPTTSPNRRVPREAASCGGPTDAFVEEIIHYNRPDTWAAAGPGITYGRDEEMTFDGAPTLHVETATSATFSGAFLWGGQQAGNRLRWSVPLRAGDTAVQARLSLVLLVDDVPTTYRTEPFMLEANGEWARMSVVADVPLETVVMGLPGIEIIEGPAELWAGYGVIERVTDDVALSPLEP
ncbi:MAG: hypothetical protein ACRBN8_43345 [Nannocystales bacterium]